MWFMSCSMQIPVINCRITSDQKHQAIAKYIVHKQFFVNLIFVINSFIAEFYRLLN